MATGRTSGGARNLVWLPFLLILGVRSVAHEKSEPCIRSDLSVCSIPQKIGHLFPKRRPSNWRAEPSDALEHAGRKAACILVAIAFATPKV
jgi:hypothetical protein